MPDASTIPYGLVVDDDPIILTDAAQMLEEAAFRTLTAMNAEEAIQLLETHNEAVTVLFTDVEMPGPINGFDLAQKVAQRWPEIAILVASGNRKPGPGDLPDRATFLGKPFSAEAVHGRLHEMLPDGKKPEPLRRAR